MIGKRKEKKILILQILIMSALDRHKISRFLAMNSEKLLSESTTGVFTLFFYSSFSFISVHLCFAVFTNTAVSFSIHVFNLNTGFAIQTHETTFSPTTPTNQTKPKCMRCTGISYTLSNFHNDRFETSSTRICFCA